jgi:hypothetical protein
MHIAHIVSITSLDNCEINPFFSNVPKGLKGLSHEIDFKNVDKNGQIWFLNFSEAPLFLVEIKHQFPGKC